MAFEAKHLRVQLPCGSVTVIEAERHDAEVRSRRFAEWQNLVPARPKDDCSDCGSGTGCGFCSGYTKGDLVFHNCDGTNPLEVRVVLDAHVLPILREKLEARLKELAAAEEALARVTDTVEKS